jgi:hypothetical protein
VDPDTPTPNRAARYILVLGGIVAVTFSWLTHEPQTAEHGPQAPPQDGLYVQCADKRSEPAPAYGTRGSPNDGLIGAVALGGSC